MDIFFEIHRDLPRESPGNNESTRRAFHLLKDLPSQPNILDIGCGPGMQTIEIAKMTNGKIIAIDTHEPFLEDLNRRAENANVKDKIQTMNYSMFSMAFENDFFDVIWSEGAIYIYGFEKGVKDWHRFIKKGGYLVVSEVSWLTLNPPKEVQDFWNDSYPAITSIEGNIEIIKKAGYKFLTSFIIPEKAWWDDYYTPLDKRIFFLKKKYHGNEKFIELVNTELVEIEMYRKYSKFYGYVFYLMQKT